MPKNRIFTISQSHLATLPSLSWPRGKTTLSNETNALFLSIFYVPKNFLSTFQQIVRTDRVWPHGSRAERAHPTELCAWKATIRAGPCFWWTWKGAPRCINRNAPRPIRFASGQGKYFPSLHPRAFDRSLYASRFYDFNTVFVYLGNGGERN